MKRLAQAIIFLLPAFVYGQISTSRSSTPQVLISNIDHLYIDYEIKNNAAPDTTIVNTINLAQYESLRLENTDVEVQDEASGYVLILYSNNRSRQNKNGLSPNNNHSK